MTAPAQTFEVWRKSCGFYGVPLMSFYQETQNA